MPRDPKVMLTITRNPLGFHSLNVLPKGRIFNAEYYPDNIFTVLLWLRRRSMGENTLFLQTMQNSAQLEYVILSA
jgi:hypothetical protein